MPKLLALLQVGVKNFDQFFCAHCPVAVWVVCRIADMKADVILHDLGHEAVHRAARGSDEVHDLGAAPFTRERALQGLDLTANAAHAVQQLGFFLNRMCHSPR